MKLMLSKTMWGSLSPYRGWKKWKSATFAEEKTSKYSSSPTRGDPNPNNCVFTHCSEFSMYAWGRKKVVTRVYVRVKAKLTLFSFMLTFPFQHTFLSLFSWIIPWGTKVWETPVTFVAQSAFRFFYIGQSCTKCILIGVIFPPCVRYWFGILKLWKRYWFDILKLRYGFDILKLWKWQRFSFSKFSHLFIASILECIKNPSLSIKSFQCDHNAVKHCQRHNGPRNWLRDLD